MQGLFSFNIEKMAKKRRVAVPKTSRRAETDLANLANPRLRVKGAVVRAVEAVGRAGDAVAGSIVLPSWMYGDPADVAERIENGELARQARRDDQALRGRRAGFGLVTEGTVRLIKRARIRELVARVMGKKR